MRMGIRVISVLFVPVLLIFLSKLFNFFKIYLQNEDNNADGCNMFKALEIQQGEGKAF